MEENTSTTDDKSTQTDELSVPTGYVLDCGHQCVMCLQRDNVPVTAFQRDHAYSACLVGRTNTGVSDNVTLKCNMSDEVAVECDTLGAVSAECDIPGEVSGNTSTPLKQSVITIPQSSDCVMDVDTEDDLINLSTINNSFRDDSKDQTFELNSDLESDNDSEMADERLINSVDLVSDTKYIVFNSCLKELLVRLKCDRCDSAVDPDDIRRTEVDSTLLQCSVYCTGGHLIIRWASQPMLGKMPAGNLLASAATLFSGQTHSHLAQFATFLNLKFVSRATFDRIQRQHLMPVIMYTWSTMQDEMLKRVKESGRLLRLAGDGRCDSPGYSAKYCTYSLLDMDTDTVITFVVVQVSETGSSCKMEAEGFRRCMSYLLGLGFTIEVLATDRHVQIRSMMKKEFSSINHQFDVWHLSNNVKKKLTQRAKSKGAEELSGWIKSICNHLWWCAGNCNGDKEWLEESWKSVVHHVANEHVFSGDLITRCPHDPIDPEVVRKKKWLQKGSKAHNALKEVVLDKRLVKDICQLSEFCHTGSLEVYHSLMTKYVPKRQEFDFDQMLARTALAVIRIRIRIVYW